MATGYPIEERMESAIEENASIAASRQKNCNGCVQAKRRCDRRTPICSRCTEKNVACVYKKSKTANRRGKGTRELTPCTEALSNIPGLSFDMNYPENIPPGFHPTPQSNHDTAPSSDTFMDNFFRFIDNNSLSSSDQWLIATEDDHLPERPMTPADEEAVMAYRGMAGCKVDNWNAYDPKTPLYFILNRVKGFTGELAAKNTTPFIHRHLYHDYKPQCVISCFTACVLYASRTPTNMHMVMRAVSDSAREFVDSEASRVIATPIEKLARSQALFLYQIIRLFDGDVTLRAQGERDMGLLKIWLDELCRIRDNLGDLARLEYALVKQQPPIQWDKWIFAECVRRTVTMAYSVIGLYELLKDLEWADPDNVWAYVHRWTLGRSLWEADSATEFRHAWNESSHFVIANFTLDNFIENGKGEDVDEFAEIFLVLYMGVDAHVSGAENIIFSLHRPLSSRAPSKQHPDAHKRELLQPQPELEFPFQSHQNINRGQSSSKSLADDYEAGFIMPDDSEARLRVCVMTPTVDGYNALGVTQQRIRPLQWNT
ncbi:hypothetical protein E0Z10_g9674 [Xylaria hypoxylon]|uniref:Zn(2)-C6 fungal-type domain-containing protein n=1 Tax=Xylaria hypoxylon TaxID=37992 RepID=A0A4Z0Y4T8_9PEZI|nr:hypothetical protein E0Z10_g9674 [Xylaria hypoxylon]